MTCVLAFAFLSLLSQQGTSQPVDLHSASIFLGIWRVGKMKGIQEGQMEKEDHSQLLSPL